MTKLLAEGPADTHLQLFRSVSAREAQGSGLHGAPCDKRRSTSFDDTHGELAGACAVDCTPEDIGISKKKPSFWHSRVWMFTKGKKATLSAIPEKEEGMTSKWKKFLYKLRSKAKDARKPAICSSRLDLQVRKCDRSGFLRGEGRSKSVENRAEKQLRLDLQVADCDRGGFLRGDGRSKSTDNQGEKQQRIYSVYPEPIPPAKLRSTAIPIWERRSVTCPPTLELNNLRVTGLRHLSRPHQTRG